MREIEDLKDLRALIWRAQKPPARFPTSSLCTTRHHCDMTMAAPTNGAHKDNNFTSMVESKFLSNPRDLGVVAVGFSGGQVRSPACSPPTMQKAELTLPDPSASQASTPRPRP